MDKLLECEPTAVLEAHPPEALPFAPLMQKSWRIFGNHTRFLLLFAFANLAPLLIFSLLIQILYAPKLDPSQDPANRPPIELTATSTTLMIIFLLMSAASALVQAAVFVHVVVGDHLAAPPGRLWLAVKRSFWRLAGTNLAKGGVLALVGFAGWFVIGLLMVIILLITGESSSSTTIIGAVLVCLVLYSIVLIAIALHLSFTDQATVVEAPGVWGFRAVSRSWALCKGSRRSILAVGALHFLGTLVLTGPHQLLVLHTHGPFLTTALAVAYVVALAVMSSLEAYFRVVWVVLYLSARKRTEPDFGLGALELYFDDNLKGPSEYLMVGVSDRV